jgi:hypothetical protein
MIEGFYQIVVRLLAVTEKDIVLALIRRLLSGRGLMSCV